MYRIKSHSYQAAKKLGVQIKPSATSGKKIDVFKNGKKIASIGATGYGDYPTFKQKYGKEYAENRRKAYRSRHKNNINVKGSPGYYAGKILW